MSAGSLSLTNPMTTFPHAAPFSRLSIAGCGTSYASAASLVTDVFVG